MENQAKRMIVGISGASGIVYGVECLKQLKQAGIETHLIVSKAALQTLKHESNLSFDDLKAMADVHYSNNDIGASIASGSFKTMGMIIVPCSIRTMSEIASGFSASLLSRAADVILKERRRLLLMVRETPLHAGHLQSMLDLTNMGGIIMPPVPAFYSAPESIEDIVSQTVARALDLFEIDGGVLKRWEG
jgi:4-hydroxy-3-polyprenylbenzoate decarboxylase